MTEAQEAAWSIYLARVKTLLTEQHHEFEQGRPVVRLSIAPPAPEHVAIIEKAMERAAKQAAESMFHTVLAPLITAIDAIDNSKTKNESLKECRVRLGVVYQTLHALKT